MPRAQSLRRFRFGASGAPGKAERASAMVAPPISRALAMVEALEDRRLLSAAVVNPGAPIIISPAPTPVAVAAKGYGTILHLQAGKAFDGYLGDLVNPKVPSGFKLSASVNWGDGTTGSAGVVSINSNGNIDVSGLHTYSKAGKFAISISVTATPASTGPVNAPIILYLGSIQGTAFVTSSGGVTIKEPAGAQFTATVGTFSYIAPGTGLHASINWGDGTAASTGTITSTGVSGIDVINFKVTGSHDYAKVGTYPIVVTVTQQSGPAGSLSPIQLVTTIDSTAIVAAPAGLNLDGTIAGTLVPAPTAATFGALYIFSNATGTAGAMGPVSASGRIQLPPLNTTGPVSGTMTLTSIGATAAGPAGSVTLTLAGPNQSGSDSIPGSLTYVITSGTGNFADATGSGTIDITLGAGSLKFTLAIHSA